MKQKVHFEYFTILIFVEITSLFFLRMDETSFLGDKDHFLLLKKNSNKKLQDN